MIILIISFFFGLGIFNAVATWIEQIVGPRGFSITEAGIAGSLIMLGGIIGALILPSLSDKLRKRRIFIIIAMLGAIPGLAGMTFAGSYWLLCISCFVFGFFLIGGGPVDLQYGAEVSYPAPEATSQGVLMFVGMLSGILFIVGPDIILEEGAAKTPAMILFLALLVVTFILSLMLRESKHIKTGDI
jgi:cyanate permease